MDDHEIRLIRELQKGFKLEKRPFLRIAKELGVSEEDVLNKIREFQEKGFIRRLGLAIKPELAGYSCNAMVVWKVSADRVEEVGNLMAGMREISHCYERETPKGWEYNMFSMIHATTQEHLEKIIAAIKEKCQLDVYKVFSSKRELKKTSMTYFAENQNGKE